MANAKFYDELSPLYDEMINFGELLDKRMKMLKEVFSGLPVKTIADAGCGPGLDSIALSLLGYKVTGFDHSAGMLEHAVRNSKAYSVSPQFVKHAVGKGGKKYSGTFDAVISLGNTLANFDPERLSLAINSFYNMLKENGFLLIQILNYKKTIQNKPLLVSRRESAENSIIRYYDYKKDKICFYILCVSKADARQSRLIQTNIYPHTRSVLVSLLKNSGFTKIKSYGSLILDEYTARESKDLVLFAVKNEKAEDGKTKKK